MSNRKDREEARRIQRRAKRFIQNNRDIVVGSEYYDINKKRTINVISSDMEMYGSKCIQVVKFSDGTVSCRDITNLLKIQEFDFLKPIKNKVMLLNPAPVETVKKQSACDMDGGDNTFPIPSGNVFIEL